MELFFPVSKVVVIVVSTVYVDKSMRKVVFVYPSDVYIYEMMV